MQGTRAFFFDGSSYILPVTLGRRTGNPAPTGRYHVDVLPRSSIIAPSEYFISDAHQGRSIAGSGVIQPVDVICTWPAPLIQVPLDNIEWTMTETSGQNVSDPRIVDAVGPVEVVESKSPPSTLLPDRFDDAQRKLFLDTWNRLPQHLRDVRFDLEGSDWSPRDILETSYNSVE